MLASKQWEITGVWGKSAQHANELVTLIVSSSRLLFLDLEIPLCCFTNNAMHMHLMKTALLFSKSECTLIVADTSNPMTTSHSRFSCPLFHFCVDYDVH